MEVSNELKSYLLEIIKPLATNKYIEDIVNKMKADIIQIFEDRFKEQEEKIISLEKKVTIQDNVIKRLQIECDNNLQYSRRSCLRIHGIEIKDNESNKDMMDILKDCYESVEVDFNPVEIDRVHRIGKVFTEKDGRKTKQVIVKYNSWDARKKCYQSRPKFVAGNKKPRPFIVSVDLTKRRYNLLKTAKGMIENNPNTRYVFADISCSLGVKLKDQSFKFFTTEKNFTT